MGKIALIAALLLASFSTPALGQESQKRTDPFALAHPDTGEAGVWIPLWLQKAELQRYHALSLCEKQRDLMGEVLEERRAQVASLKAANLAITEANSGLKERAAALSLQLEEAQDDVGLYERWAWGSTAAAVVAISVLVATTAL